MPVYLGSDKVGVTKELGNDRLQYKCDVLKSLYYEFREPKSPAAVIEILKGLDTSKVETFYGTFYSNAFVDAPNINTSSGKSFDYMFYNCSRLKTIPLYNLQNATSMNRTFAQCIALTELPEFDTSNVTSMEYVLQGCTKLTSIPSWNTRKVKSFNNFAQGCSSLVETPSLDLSSATNTMYMFGYCSKLQTVNELDFYNVTSISDPFIGCKELMNVTAKNIRRGFALGSGTSYGTKITLDSLVNTIKELWDYSGTTSSYKLTLSTASKNLIANVYVKLVDVTDEMLAQDQYAANKKPCVVCESTDEGAMTITEYVTSKKWTIA